MLPAAMKLLGDWNWYFPSWLEWLPHIGGEGGGEGGGGDAPRAGSDQPRLSPVPA